MNSVNLIGRITRDLELKHGQNGNAYTKFSIAVNRKFNKDEADFINCVAFGKTAELIAQYIKKGDQLGITGAIVTGNYEKDGVKHYTFDVIVENITFIGGKKTTGDSTTTATVNKKEEDENSDFPF